MDVSIHKSPFVFEMEELPVVRYAKFTATCDLLLFALRVRSCPWVLFPMRSRTSYGKLSEPMFFAADDEPFHFDLDS